MNPMARVAALVVVVPATYYFVYWLPLSLLGTGREEWIARAVAVACAVAAGWFVWVKMASVDRGAVASPQHGQEHPHRRIRRETPAV